MGIFILSGILLLASWGASALLRRKFRRYASMPISSGLSGAEVAFQMLRDHHIQGVIITCTEGELTDHYNPATRAINLSEAVYYGRNAGAAAVAAHETGHAVQHAKAYAFLMFRSALVPVLSIVSNWVGWVLLIGVLLINATPWVLGVGVGILVLTTLFSFITLPVEFDASRRALEWIKQSRVVNTYEYKMAKNALWWAATTYVISAIGSLAMLAHYGLLLLGRGDD